MKLFSGKIALVTGASRGLGKGIALNLAEHGAFVVVNYRESENLANQVVEQISQNHGSAIAVKADVTQKDQVQQIFDDVKMQAGPVDILVNNVGDFLQKSLSSTTSKDWHHIINTNLHSVFNCCQIALPDMINKDWGRIINIGLVNANKNQAFSQITPYAIAKAGALTLSKSLAMETAPFGITVNVVSPGLMDNGSLSEKDKTEMEKSIPIKRLGTVDDLNGIINFLLSEKASYITGADIAVSGGWGI
jgi:NAD(P)-dependent dehydrogenase (short-subunit alcohol dehydrogenase family)